MLGQLRVEYQSRIYLGRIFPREIAMSARMVCSIFRQPAGGMTRCFLACLLLGMSAITYAQTPKWLTAPTQPPPTEPTPPSPRPRHRPPAATQPAPPAENQPTGPRVTIDLNTGWRFARMDIPGAQSPIANEATWQAVNLPHTWNNYDGQDGGNNYHRGPAWYRRHLAPDAHWPDPAGKSYFLHFDGAATVTDVYVNGKPVGSHSGAFGAFCFDITKFLHPLADNIIAVRVNNAKNEDIPPLGGDFNICGGLYRGVQLLITNELSITPLDDASPGVYIKQTSVSKDHANLEITTKVRNAGEAKKASVYCAIVDQDDKIVAEANSDIPLPTGGTADVIQRTAISDPHLWQGIKDPYLYKVRIAVSDGTTVTDAITQPLGLRFFRVDPSTGFTLNGVPYPLHGVNRHQERLDKGWAISAADHDEDFKLIKEMGCTAVRLCHYEHAQHFYDLCDRGGMVAWAELCLVNQINDSREFSENARQQLRELIKQNYNHPSIIFWSLFNELDFPKVAAGSTAPPPWDLITQLNKQAKELDPTRLTTAATARPPEHPVNFITDIIAFNWYYGWYGGKPTDWAAALDKLHAKYPTRSIGISEYGAGASINQHELDPKRPKTAGPWHPEEWQQTVHEAAWKAMKKDHWLWGTFLWCMFDFAADWRNEGDHPGRNDKGLVTADHKTRKDAFYFYKANWSDDAVLYITGRHFTPRSMAVTPIKIYSNCESVELRVNGKSCGTHSLNEDHIFLWKDIPLKDGENAIEASGTKLKMLYRDVYLIQNTLPPTTQPATAPAKPPR